MIHTLNERFGIDLAIFDHNPETVAALHDERGYHAGPNQDRAAIKKAVREAFGQIIRQSSRAQKKLTEAEELHQRWTEMSS